MTTPKLFNVGVKAVVRNDNSLLLLRRELKDGLEFWDLPGGRIEGDETFQETLVRELNEELPNAKVLHMSESIEGVFRVSRDVENETGLILLYYTVDMEIPEELEISDEHKYYRWISDANHIPQDGLNSVAQDVFRKLLTKAL